MHKKIQQRDIAYLIADNCSKIKNPYTKLESLNNPNWSRDLKHEYFGQITSLLKSLEDQYVDLVPFVKDMRWKISDITEHTAVCAVYLLLCSVLRIWDSIFLLAKSGHYSSVMSLLRMMDEALTQCNLFAFDFQEWKHVNLDTWFSGEIITNKIWREKMWALHEDWGVDVYSMTTYIYGMESQIAHSGYVGMIENISPFNEDFDFDGPTGYYRTVWALWSGLNHMTEFNIALKWAYLLILKDHAGYDKIDLILSKYNPTINQETVSQDIKEMFPKK